MQIPRVRTLALAMIPWRVCNDGNMVLFPLAWPAIVFLSFLALVIGVELMLVMVNWWFSFVVFIFP